jgi:hypothetical protein
MSFKTWRDQLLTFIHFIHCGVLQLQGVCFHLVQYIFTFSILSSHQIAGLMHVYYQNERGKKSILQAFSSFLLK